MFVRTHVELPIDLEETVAGEDDSLAQQRTPSGERTRGQIGAHSFKPHLTWEHFLTRCSLLSCFLSG